MSRLADRLPVGRALCRPGVGRFIHPQGPPLRGPFLLSGSFFDAKQSFCLWRRLLTPAAATAVALARSVACAQSFSFPLAPLIRLRGLFTFWRFFS